MQKFYHIYFGLHLKLIISNFQKKYKSNFNSNYLLSIYINYILYIIYIIIISHHIILYYIFINLILI